MDETTTAFDWTSFWAGFWSFIEFWHDPLTVIAVIVGAVIASRVLSFAITRVVGRIVSGAKKKQNVDDTQSLQASPLAAVRIVQRTRALGSVLTSAVTAAIVILTLLILITIMFPNATGAFAVISAAVGAGLGFGAQNIVKDVLNGLFMVGEDQLGVGDVVDLGPATGVVEVVGIRITQIRDVNGTLWSVRNGEIIRVGNMSQGWSRVIIDLAVPYNSDVDAVQERILVTAVEMSTSSKWRSHILEKPEVWGIESISAEAVVIRIVIKTRSASKDDVARELRKRLKSELDTMGVRLPALNTVVLSGFEGAASVKGARPPRTRSIPTAPAAPLSVTPAPVPKSSRTPPADPRIATKRPKKSE